MRGALLLCYRAPCSRISTILGQALPRHNMFFSKKGQHHQLRLKFLGAGAINHRPSSFPVVFVCASSSHVTYPLIPPLLSLAFTRLLILIPRPQKRREPQEIQSQPVLAACAYPSFRREIPVHKKSLRLEINLAESPSQVKENYINIIFITYAWLLHERIKERKG